MGVSRPARKGGESMGGGKKGGCKGESFSKERGKQKLKKRSGKAGGGFWLMLLTRPAQGGKSSAERKLENSGQG